MVHISTSFLSSVLTVVFAIMYRMYSEMKDTNTTWTWDDVTIDVAGVVIFSSLLFQHTGQMSGC